MSDKQARIHAFVSGVVQGVGFRYFTLRIARELGLKGFVRNLPDGRVEVVAEGDKEALARLIDKLHVGPWLARVESVDVRWEEYKGEFDSFDIEF